MSVQSAWASWRSWPGQEYPGVTGAESGKSCAVTSQPRGARRWSGGRGRSTPATWTSTSTTRRRTYTRTRSGEIQRVCVDALKPLKNMFVLWSCVSDFFSRNIWIQFKSLVVSINQRRHSVIFYQSPHSPSGSFPEISSFLNILLNHIIFAPTLIIGKLNFEGLEENLSFLHSPFNSRGRLKLLKCGRFKVDSRGATSKSCSTCNFNSGWTTFTDSLNNPSPRLAWSKLFLRFHWWIIKCLEKRLKTLTWHTYLHWIGSLLSLMLETYETFLLKNIYPWKVQSVRLKLIPATV